MALVLPPGYQRLGFASGISLSPGLGRGDMTLRGCSTGLGSIPSDLLFGRDRKRLRLGWRRSVLVARTAAAPQVRSPLDRKLPRASPFASPPPFRCGVPD